MVPSAGQQFVHMDTTCGTLLRELQGLNFAQHIWDEIGESEVERNKMLLELENECLEVYCRKADQASHSRAKLHQSLVDKEAELASLITAIGDMNLHCQVQVHYNFRSLTTYLSINYLDRFLSSYQLPLLSIAYLSLTAKMEETEVPALVDLQVGDTRFVFEARTIHKMELLILTTLKWRLRSKTPFNFIDYLLYRLQDTNTVPQKLISRTIAFIVNTERGSMKMGSVVTWSISTSSSPIFGKAAYNPILGETHHVSSRNLNLLLQHVGFINSPLINSFLYSMK